MIALLVALPASAASFSVPSGSTPTLADALDAAEDAGPGPHTITIDASKYTASEEDSLEVDGLELTIESSSTSTRATLPPITGSDAILTLNDVAFTTTETFDTSFGTFTVAVGLSDSTLTINRSEFAGVAGVGLLLVNSDLYASELEARDGSSGRALESLSDKTAPTLSLLNSTFLRNGGGDIKVLANSRNPATLYVWQATQEGSWSPYGPALYAEHVNVEYHQSTVSGVEAAGGAPLQLIGGEAYFDGMAFLNNYGSTAGLIEATPDGNLEIYGSGTTISGNSSSGGIEMSATGTGALHIRNANWTPGGYVYQSGGSVQVSYSLVQLDEDLGAQAILYSLNGLGSVHRSHICLAGGSFSNLGLIWGKQGTLAVTESIFTGLASGSTTVMVRAQGMDTSAGNTSVYFVDNTLVNWGAGSLIFGTMTDLTLVNNLFANSGTSVSGSASSLYDGYNLRYSSSDRSSLTLSYKDDVSADPTFATPYDGSCDWLPELQDGSPAIDAGDPNLYGHDGGASDIGAIDYGDDFWTGGGSSGGDTGDTGDTGTVPDTGDTADTGGGDTDSADADTAAGADADEDGVPDARDCNDDDASVFPGAEDVPDDAVDQNCDGVEATTSYAGGCGCDAGAPAPAAAAAIALALSLSLRRCRR